jgi:hypothetical protein
MILPGEREARNAGRKSTVRWRSEIRGGGSPRATKGIKPRTVVRPGGRECRTRHGDSRSEDGTMVPQRVPDAALARS